MSEIGQNSVAYWARVFRDRHAATVDDIFALGAAFEDCAETAGDSTLGVASVEAGYSKSSVSRLRTVARDERMRPIGQHLPASWRTLYELTTLNESEWDAALAADAIHPNMTRADVRKLRRPEFDAPHDLEDLSGRAYEVVYADPPWRYEHVKTESRAIENQYPTMALDEICALRVADICAEDATLFLWATSPKLAESLAVIDAWGFSYRTSLVWVKDQIGMGYYARQRHELLLVAVRGSPGTPEPSTRPDSVIEAPRQAHSAKPPQCYDMLETMYPDRRRVELFSRTGRTGWSAWGNQALPEPEAAAG